MSLFEEQLRYRKNYDNSNLNDAIDTISAAVMGDHLCNVLGKNEIADSAIDEILNYYYSDFKKEYTLQNKTIDEQINFRMRPFGIKNRTVMLEKGWYHHAAGAMLGTLKEDGRAVALIPGRFSKYKLVDIKNGKKFKLNRKNEKLLNREAICFYEPLPRKALTIGDLFSFMFMQLRASDVVLILVLMALSVALGLLSPRFTKWLFSDVLDSGNLRVLISLAVFMVCFSVSQLCLNIFQSLVNSKIGIKQNVAVQAAVMDRIMSLDVGFFKNYSAGELSRRMTFIQELCSTMFSAITTTGLMSLFSLIYIGQIFRYAPSLVAPALLIIGAIIIHTIFSTLIQVRVTRERMERASKTSGITYSTISGIQKIKLAGAEKRMFSRWAKSYSKEARLEYNPPLVLKLSNTITLAISLIGTLILYYMATISKVGVSDFYAFNTSFALVSSAFMSLASITATIANIRPTLEMVKPILETVPEMENDKEIIKELYGAIEFSHVSFRYSENMPNIIEDFSLSIEPGEYLAIVGPTGCGKSTLLRLLLGFETPQKGTIYYDKRDISRIDLESLRKKIGSVMQDGKLFIQDVYSNIVITAPELDMDAAWEAAEIASIADDIRAMPMGMHTLISEGHGGISGGQKQRIMIARAVAPKPKILMFDEATNALDNITQKKVSEAIDKLNCTRVVIAHRLSTIQHADRIIYIEDGKILEEGKFDELMTKKGYFAKFVERQRLDA